MKLDLLLLLILFSTIVYTQDIQVESIKDIKPLSISGGLSLNNTINPLDTISKPFTYILTGNLNINILEQFDIPINFSYSNMDFDNSVGNPFEFNTFSLRPSYKWVKLYIGDNTMNFSPYTYGGILFRGFGIDLTPEGNFKMSFFGGRIQESYNYSEKDTTGNTPSYTRMGYGINLEYKINSTVLKFNTFYGGDIKESITQPPDSLEIYPEENVAIGIGIDTYLYKKLKLSLEYNNSAITENILSDEVGFNYRYLSGYFIKNKESTKNYERYKIGISLPLFLGNFGLTYEMVDPRYRTLGSLMVNNDLESYSVDISQNFMGGNLNVNSNVGLQRNDLDGSLESNTNNILLNIGGDMKVNDKLDLTLSYSNVYNVEQVKNVFDDINNPNKGLNELGIDTTKFSNVSQNVSFGMNYIISKSKEKEEKPEKSINININFSDVSSLEGNLIRKGNLTQIYNISGGYNYKSISKWNINSTMDYSNTYTYLESKGFTIGPSVTVSKSFLEEKLTNSLNISYNTTYQDGEKHVDNYNFSLNCAYVLLKKHNISFSTNFNISESKIGNSSENFVILVGYNYNFNIL